MHAAKIVKVQRLAMKMGAPIVGINDSGGARIQEAVDALEMCIRDSMWIIQNMTL